MHVLVIRHALAEDRASFKKAGQSDEMRPLTVDGRRRMRRGAQGLKRVVDSLDLIVTSPLIRSVETAHIVAKAFEKVHVAELKELSPGGRPEGIFRFLVDQGKETVALIGHEPDLGCLICLSLGCKIADRVPLKKGGAALLVFDGPIAAGAATLQAMLTPQLLRKLAR